MKHYILTLCLLVSSLLINAQTSVTPFNPSQDPLNGIIYSLPKTQINITITARYTIEKAGPFYQYAERYLATKEIITTNSENWTIDNIAISTTPIADQNRTFQVAFDTRGISNNLTFYKENILAGVNINTTLPTQNTHLSATTTLQSNTPNLSFNYNKLNEDALVATSMPKMAEMAAQQIYHIRESRTALLSADLDQLPDGKALELMLQRLDQEEDELLSLFIGKTYSYTMTKTYSITPEDDIKDYVIARISSTEGLTDSNNVIGEPIYLNLKGTYYNAPSIDPKQEKAPKGFYYNVPGEAFVSIDHNNLHTTSTLLIAQFGYTTYLSASLTNNKTTRITFNPELGTILKIEK